MSLRFPRIAYILLLATWATAIALASGSDFGRQDPKVVEPRVTAASGGNGSGNGPISMSNSKANAAILTAANMKPGSSATGTVAITSDSSVDADISLTRENLSDVGAGTLKLSNVLDLLIQDVTAPSSPTTVYSGKLGAMPARQLGTYPKRTTRSYRFTVTFPSSAPSGYQGRSTSVDFVWTETKSTAGPKK
jgi:hypothetical protein